MHIWHSYYNSGLSHFYLCKNVSTWVKRCSLGACSYSPSAKRVSPNDDQAVSTACLDPVVQVEGISGETALSRLPGGISKPWQRFSHQLLLTDRSQSCLSLPQGGSHSEGKPALDPDLKLNCCVLTALQQTTHRAPLHYSRVIIWLRMIINQCDQVVYYNQWERKEALTWKTYWKEES